MNSRIITAAALVALSFGAIGPVQAQVYPAQAPPPQNYQQACPQRVTPSGQEIYGRFMRHFAPLGLMPQQQQQIQSYVNAFASRNPAGSPLNPGAMQQLHSQVRSVLSPQQLGMLEQMHHQQPQMPHRCP